MIGENEVDTYFMHLGHPLPFNRLYGNGFNV